MNRKEVDFDQNSQFHQWRLLELLQKNSSFFKILLIIELSILFTIPSL